MALIGWAGDLLGAQVQFLQVAAGLDVAGADAVAQADAGDMKTQALGGFQIAAFEAGEEKPSGGALLGQRNGVPVGRFLADTAPPTMTPGSHISREGMKPFTKPPKMTTSKVWPKRSSGAAMATAGAGDVGVAAASFSRVSVRLARERAVSALDEEELSRARLAAAAGEVTIVGWSFPLRFASSLCASR